MGVDVKFDMSGFNRVMDRAPKIMQREIRGAFSTYLRNLQAKLIAQRLSGAPLKRRSGALARSFTTKVGGNGLAIFGILSSRSKYARIHEEGGIIRPVQSEWLWIPGDELRTAAGVFRGWEDVPWHRVFTIESRRNPANRVALLEHPTGSGQLHHIATLTKEVRIPPRLGLLDLVRADRQERILTLNAGVRRAIKKARGR